MMKDRRTTGQRPADAGRRRFLKAFGSGFGLAAITPAALAPGCSGGGGAAADGEGRYEVGELAPGQRVVVRHRDQPVEIVRTADGVRARSLICTHMSCTVRWDPEDAVYRCPCHKGEFDAEGRVIAGPPLAPLREFPARLEAGAVVLGG